MARVPMLRPCSASPAPKSLPSWCMTLQLHIGKVIVHTITHTSRLGMLTSKPGMHSMLLQGLSFYNQPCRACTSAELPALGVPVHMCVHASPDVVEH